MGADRWSRRDAVLAVVLGAAGAVLALWYMPIARTTPNPPGFYQIEFGPAVMQACGRGFANPDYATVPAFAAFLEQRSDTLQCADIPADVRIKPLNGFQGVTRYLMTFVALVWRVTGISWRAVDIVVAAFAAATVATAYLALRTMCGPWLSVAVTLLWACSPRHLQNLPHLRDYSKAPFFMVMLIAMALTLVERRPKRLLAIALIFGAIQGLGFGMRTDMVLNLVPFFLVLAATAFDDGARQLGARVAAGIAALALLVIVSFPVLQTYARNSSLWHVVLLGFTAPYDENLNIGFPRTTYSYPYAHNDSYIVAVVRGFWNRLHPGDEPLVMVTRPYDSACREYFVRLASLFPGDMLTRGVASIARVANLPFWLPIGHEVPLGVTNPTLASWWQRRASLMRRLDGRGPLLVAVIIAVMGMRGLQYVVLGFALMGFWAAIPAVEFQGRHIFQYEFVVLAGAAASAATIVRTVLSLRQSGRAADVARRAIRSVTAVAAGVALLAGAVVVTRRAQIPNVRSLVAAYMRAPVAPLDAAAMPISDERVRLAADLFGQPDHREGAQEVLVRADFDFARCGNPPSVNATFRYEDSNPVLAQDFSRRVPMEYLGAEPVHVFLPVYAVARDWKIESRFVGVEVPASFARCVTLSRVADVAALPMVLPMTIEPDWERKLYQRVRLDNGLGY